MASKLNVNTLNSNTGKISVVGTDLLDLSNSTDGIILPSGPTSSEGTPENNAIRFDTTDNKLKVYPSVGGWKEVIDTSSRFANRKISIVRDGLVLNLDSGNSSSYPGSGNTWFDLSGNVNNGTLENGVSYDQDGGGTLSFDGTDDYVEIGARQSIQSIGSFATIETWFKSAAIGSDRFNLMVGWGQGTSFYSNFGIGNWYGRSPDESIFLGLNSAAVVYSERDGSTKYHDGNWYHAVATIGPGEHRIYVNGIQKTIAFDYGNNSYNVSNIFGFTSGTNLQIGLRPYGNGYFLGSIPIVRIYSRILSSDEITQNFNATRARFLS